MSLCVSVLELTCPDAHIFWHYISVQKVPARYPLAAYEAESAMHLFRPSDTTGALGLHSALIRRVRDTRIVVTRES